MSAILFPHSPNSQPISPNPLVNLPPTAAPKQASNAIKAVAGYEIIKGLGALAVAIAVLLWHERLPHIVARIVQTLHRVFGNFFVQPLDNLGHHADRISQNWLMAFWFIIGYTLLRFVEAYGLYKDRTWAYWYSVLGYGIFIPVELYAIISGPFELFTLLTFLLNVVVVVVVYLNMKKKGLLGQGSKAESSFHK